MRLDYYSTRADHQDVFKASCDENRNLKIWQLSDGYYAFANGDPRDCIYYEELMQIKRYWHHIYRLAFFRIRENVNKVAQFWANLYFNKKEEQAAQFDFIIPENEFEIKDKLSLLQFIYRSYDNEPTDENSPLLFSAEVAQDIYDVCWVAGTCK